MDMKEIYTLIEKFEKSTLTELSIEGNASKITIKREMKNEYRSEMPVQSILTKQPEQEAVVEDKNILCIKAPLVGTFYRSSTPEAKPYVMIGQKVKKGDVLALIEAMKMMNEVVAPMDGIIEDILAENDELVQYEETLIKMKGLNHV